MALEEYVRKRKFERTPEPPPKPKRQRRLFVSAHIRDAIRPGAMLIRCSESTRIRNRLRRSKKKGPVSFVEPPFRSSGAPDRSIPTPSRRWNRRTKCYECCL